MGSEIKFTGSKSVKGTDIAVGDYRLVGWQDHQRVVVVTPGQHPMGARYLDVTLEDGREERCWEGFLYRILVGVPSAQPCE